MPGFMQAIEILPNARKRGNYYRFSLTHGDLKINGFRYYPNEDKLWYPARKLKGRFYTESVEFTKRFSQELYRQCRKRWKKSEEQGPDG